MPIQQPPKSLRLRGFPQCAQNLLMVWVAMLAMQTETGRGCRKSTEPGLVKRGRVNRFYRMSEPSQQIWDRPVAWSMYPTTPGFTGRAAVGLCRFARSGQSTAVGATDTRVALSYKFALSPAGMSWQTFSGGSAVGERWGQQPASGSAAACRRSLPTNRPAAGSPAAASRT